jgi:hypothetical protein
MMNKQQIEEMTCSRDFVAPVLFPAGAVGEIEAMGAIGAVGTIDSGFRVLEAAGRDDLFERLKKEFPEAEVLQQKEGQAEADGFFDYINAAGIKYPGCGEETDQLFKGLLSRLTPAGVMSAHVCGFSGYYGLVMLGAGIRRLSRGENQEETLKIARAIIDQLPQNHPAFSGEILKCRDEAALKELLELSSAIDDVDKLFTVSKLMEAIPQWGGRFMRWVFPSLYEPTERFTSWFQPNEHRMLRAIENLSEPRRSIACELLTASPSGHYFLAQKI